MKKYFLFLPLCWCVLAVVAGAQSSGAMAWKMALLRWNGSEYESVPFQKTLFMAKEDALQLFIQTDSACFCYVLNETSAGKLSVVFNSALKPGVPLYLPDAEADFQLVDPSGTDKYFVIVSSSRQATLEVLLKAADKNGFLANVTDIEDEILRIRHTSLKIAIDGEKPVAIGGVTRGAKQPKATQMEGKEVYVKTITIKH